MRGSSTGVLVAAAVLLGACAAEAPPRPPPPPPPQTHVSYHAVADKDAKHYRISSMQSIVNPLATAHNHPPVYPPALVARHLPPVSVRVKLIVDTHGKVADTRFNGAPGDATRAAFRQAVDAAVRQWRFVPMTISQWVSEPDGSQRVVKQTPKPFSQDYVFTFRLVNGKPVVTNGALPAPASSGAP